MENQEKRSHRMQFIFLIALFVIMPLSYSASLSDMILICFILFVVFEAIKSKKIRRLLQYVNLKKGNIGTVVMSFYGLLLWNIICLLVHGGGIASIVRLVQVIGCFFVFCLATIIDWKLNVMKKIQNIILVIYAFILLVWIMEGCPFSDFTFIFGNSNVFGIIILCWIAFMYCLPIKKSRKGVVLFIGCFWLLLSSARSCLLALLFFVFFYGVWKKGQKCRSVNVKSSLWNGAFIGTTAGVILFTYLYSKMENMEIGKKLQILSQRYFGKNFFSGRDDLWEGVLDLIMEKPVAGYGLDALPSDYLEINLSAHNLFLQIGFQIGIIGILLLFIILWNIMMCCKANCKSAFSGYSIALIFAIIVHEVFEVCLLQNNLIVGLEMWFLLGLGCNKSISEIMKNNAESVVKKI